MTYNNSIEDISVVIPTFNRSNLLKRAINSVIKQTIEPSEIIVIDNCSTDQTHQMVSSLFPDINGNLKTQATTTSFGISINTVPPTIRALSWSNPFLRISYSCFKNLSAIDDPIPPEAPVIRIFFILIEFN